MLSGTHRNSLQEQVIYGRPALEALTDLAKSFGAHRLMITSTASLAGPGGLAQRLAKDSGAACVGIFAGVLGPFATRGRDRRRRGGTAAWCGPARGRGRWVGDRRDQGHAVGALGRGRER